MREITLSDGRVVHFKPVTLRVLRESGRIERANTQGDGGLDGTVNTIYRCSFDGDEVKFFDKRSEIEDLPYQDLTKLMKALEEDMGAGDNADPLPQPDTP